MKKLFGLIGILLLLAPAANAAGDLWAYSYPINVGYSTADFVTDTADPDSAVKKIVLMLDTSDGTTRYDSVTTVTDPDTIAITGLVEGTTYYWTIEITDSTTTIYYPSDRSPVSFTTTDLTQSTSVSLVGYSHANIIIDSVVAAGLSLDSVRLDIDKTDGTTYSASITTVTVPQDTFAVTSLDEGATYYYRTIAFLTDSSAADTLTAASFTTTDLTVGITVTSLAGDSIGVIVDTSGIIVDSLIFQTGAGLVTAVAETLTTVTGVDTFYVVDMIPGGVYSYRVLAFLPDSSAIETTTTYTYTMADPWAYVNINTNPFAGDVQRYKFTLDQASDTGSTGLIEITRYEGVSITGILLGEDDAAQYDSGYIVLYTINQVGTRLIVDTLMAKEPDTATTIGEVQQYLFDLPSYAVVDTAAIAADDFYQYIEIVGQLTCHADSVAKVSNTIGTRPIYVTVELHK